MALRRAALLLILLTALLGAAKKMQDNAQKGGPATAAHLLFNCIDLLADLWTWACDPGNCDPPALWGAAAQQMAEDGLTATGLNCLPLNTSQKYFVRTILSVSK